MVTLRESKFHDFDFLPLFPPLFLISIKQEKRFYQINGICIREESLSFLRNHMIIKDINENYKEDYICIYKYDT